jgi:glycosyltransferase involved in cell wall biosynthesis
MNGIFVFHPCLQHSHQLAWALHDGGMLQGFWSGVPVKQPNSVDPIWLPDKYSRRLKEVPIPENIRRHPIGFPLLLRLFGKCPRAVLSEDDLHRVFHWFDWWTSRYVPRLAPKVVVAYENSAFQTFLAAKRSGATCVLDAASLHHSVGRTLNVVPKTRYSAQVDQRKAAEIDLADCILTCSPLAADSYIAAGVPAGKLKTIMMGTDLPSIPYDCFRKQPELNFIFAGALSMRKAVDIILAVFRRLHTEGSAAKVMFVGGASEKRWLIEIARTPNASYLPHVSQSELYQLFGQSDCLLLPSRFDSFGMVVAEAMACGTPAIVSKQTGSKAIMEIFPKSGWVIDCNMECLYECIKERIINRDQLLLARQHARHAAKHFTWNAYRKRAANTFREMLG